MQPPSTVQMTRAFRNGNSLAVRIPANLAFDADVSELEIERIGSEIRIRPLKRPLNNVLQKFANFSNDFFQEGRGNQDQTERELL